MTRGLVLGILLFIPSVAQAQIMLRSDCTTITGPVVGQTWCVDTTAKMIKVWTGAAYLSVTLDSIVSTGGNLTLTGGNNIVLFAATAAAVEDNTSLGRLHFVGGTSGYAFYAHDGSTQRIGIADNGEVTMTGLALSALGTPANGTLAYCSDCRGVQDAGWSATAICTTSAPATGAMARRLGSAWYCH